MVNKDVYRQADSRQTKYTKLLKKLTYMYIYTLCLKKAPTLKPSATPSKPNQPPKLPNC